MKTLANTIVDIARFIELSSDEIIDPDAAVQALEMMIASLQEATEDEKGAMASAVSTAMDTARERGASVDELEFYGEFISGIGIDD